MPSCRHCHKHFDFDPTRPNQLYCRRTCQRNAKAARKGSGASRNAVNRDLIDGECVFCRPQYGQDWRSKGGIECRHCAEIKKMHDDVEAKKFSEAVAELVIYALAAAIRPAGRQPAGFQHWAAVPYGLDPLEPTTTDEKRYRAKRDRYKQRAG